MEKEQDHIDEQIGKVLAGEANNAEREFIDRWRNESPANEKHFNHFKEIFEHASTSPVQLHFDTDAAWQKVKQKINSSERGKVVSMPFSSWFSPMRVAATIALIVGATWLIYKLSSPQIQTVQLFTEVTPRPDTLPDGTAAYLNRNTTLAFEYNLREKTRKVKLNGEAYFSVRHDDARPFIVETDEVLVRDIGTEFNLKAYAEKDTIEIIVTEGEVQFYTQNDPGLNLKAGEKGIYSKRNRKFYKIDKPDTNDLAYKTKVFSFNNTDLATVVKLLNEVYHSKIKLANEELHRCKLTATFKEDNPDIIAEVIAETMGLELTRKDDQLILSGKGCD